MLRFVAPLIIILAVSACDAPTARSRCEAALRASEYAPGLVEILQVTPLLAPIGPAVQSAVDDSREVLSIDYTYFRGAHGSIRSKATCIVATEGERFIGELIDEARELRIPLKR